MRLGRWEREGIGEKGREGGGREGRREGGRERGGRGIGGSRGIDIPQEALVIWIPEKVVKGGFEEAN